METKDLIIDDSEKGIFRYHRSSLTSPHILELEMERIFSRCWVYLGHESEVEKPGDYRRRTVAGRPLFFVRGRDDRVRVFLNTCPHRGALICRHDDGNARVFQCFYHAWTFGTNGGLVGRPDESGYSELSDRADMALKTPPRVDSYRGFYFVSFNEHIEDLRSYLAGAREYLDFIADQSEVGMKVSNGHYQFSIRANWKLMAENSTDIYHLVPVHRTYFEYLSDLTRDTLGEEAQMGGTEQLGARSGPDPGQRTRGGNNPVTWLAELSPAGTPSWVKTPKEEITRIRKRLFERFGEERAQVKWPTIIASSLIYPNLVINDFFNDRSSAHSIPLRRIGH